VALLPERASLDARLVPGWYTDAKLGIFVHWGLYSIPAFAARTRGDYAEFMGDLPPARTPGAASPTPSGTSTR
jgi:alpha-L-fucosidase